MHGAQRSAKGCEASFAASVVERGEHGSGTGSFRQTGKWVYSVLITFGAESPRARIVSITMVDALDAEGFTSKLDEEITRMNFGNISEAEKLESVKATMQELYKAGLPEDLAAAWEQALMEAHPEAGKENILAYRSTGRYLRAQIEEASEAFEELAANQVLRLAWSSSLRQFRPLAAC